VYAAAVVEHNTKGPPAISVKSTWLNCLLFI